MPENKWYTHEDFEWIPPGYRWGGEYRVANPCEWVVNIHTGEPFHMGMTDGFYRPIIDPIPPAMIPREVALKAMETLARKLVGFAPSNCDIDATLSAAESAHPVSEKFDIVSKRVGSTVFLDERTRP